ncbi:Release factor glutamine methyltransferase [Streptomyces cyaneofuscatus]
MRTPVAAALDLGTGSGIQALHAAAHATRVTATDVNPRALHITALTLALSGAPAADLREGSLYEPVADDETYDLIVSNPPFVISPGARLTYRDGGMGGDDLCRTLVQQAGERLNEGGFAQFLANWQHVEGEDWQDRLRSWVPRGCDAWIVQREVQDVTQYAELWLRDAGDHRGDPAEYQARYDAWLDEFEARKVKAVGFGWITLRRTGRRRALGRGRGVAAPGRAAARRDRARPLRPRRLPARPRRRGPAGGALRLAGEVVQEQVGLPGAEDPEHVVLRQNRGMRRATRVDTVGAGFAGVCDGTHERRPHPGRHRPAGRRGPGGCCATARPRRSGCWWSRASSNRRSGRRGCRAWVRRTRFVFPAAAHAVLPRRRPHPRPVDGGDRSRPTPTRRPSAPRSPRVRLPAARA